MISDIDKDKSGGINFDEFLSMMTAKIVRAAPCYNVDCTHSSHASVLQSDTDSRDDVMKVFHLFDADSKGKITLHDLRRVARELGEPMTGERQCIPLGLAADT
jgi:Ca2+-binding EF-hand superfamily protein